MSSKGKKGKNSSGTYKPPPKKGKLWQVFLEVSVNHEKPRRIVIELRNDIVPKTCDNFRHLCIGEKGIGYKDTPFHRIVANTLAQGGDVLKRDGSGSYSIYDHKPFEDENFTLKHYKEGIVSMANNGPNTNGSQFFITLTKLPELDGKHVVFGEVIDGMDVVKKIGEVGTANGKPKEEVIITKAGQFRGG